MIPLGDRKLVTDGVVLEGTYKGDAHRCAVVQVTGAGGVPFLAFVVDGAAAFKSPTSAAESITGSARNGYAFWTIDDTHKVNATERKAARAAFPGPQVDAALVKATEAAARQTPSKSGRAVAKRAPARAR